MCLRACQGLLWAKAAVRQEYIVSATLPGPYNDSTDLGERARAFNRENNPLGLLSGAQADGMPFKLQDMSKKGSGHW